MVSGSQRAAHERKWRHVIDEDGKGYCSGRPLVRNPDHLPTCPSCMYVKRQRDGDLKELKLKVPGETHKKAYFLKMKGIPLHETVNAAIDRYLERLESELGPIPQQLNGSSG